VSIFVVAVLLPIFPPDQAIGAIGWAITVPVLSVLAGSVWYLAHRPTLITFSVHLIAAYTCVFLLAVLQWLAGGWDAPYHELLLTLALGNALTHPPRRFVPLMVAIWISALAPLTYGGDHGALASVLVSLLLWTGMSCFCLVLMLGIRAHRAGLTAKGEAAERMARVDALTGLENRRAFDETFPHVFARGRRSGRPLTLVLADLDGFKQVNDRHGHLAGDAVLTAVGAALRLHARASDRAFRWAGDEFAVLLEDTDEQTAAHVCSRLREAISRAVTSPGGAPVTITVGWARDDGHCTLEELAAAADDAMLARKRDRARLATTS
jgi:diguanylate cyclase (GGDEF)-like protein